MTPKRKIPKMTVPVLNRLGTNFLDWRTRMESKSYVEGWGDLWDEACGEDDIDPGNPNQHTEIRKAAWGHVVESLSQEGFNKHRTLSPQETSSVCSNASSVTLSRRKTTFKLTTWKTRFRR